MYGTYDMWGKENVHETEGKDGDRSGDGVEWGWWEGGGMSSSLCYSV